MGVRAHPAARRRARPRLLRAHRRSTSLATIPVTVFLVVVEDEGAAGILLGTFGTGAVFLAWLLWQQRRRLSLRFELPLLRRMIRFGLPTMPAELSLYSLNFIDRILIVRLAGLAEAGLYALAIKFAQGDQRARPRLPARLAAARLLDRRRRRGAPRLQPRRSPGSPPSAPSPSPACGCSRAGSSTCSRRPSTSRPTRRSACWRRGSRSTRSTWCSSSSSAAPAAPSSTSRRRSPGTVVNIVLNLILIPLARVRRRRDRPGRLLRGRARAHVRAHPAALPGPLRVGAAGAAGRR